MVMHKMHLPACLCLLLMPFRIAGSQEAQRVMEPEYLGQPHSLNPINGSLIPLDRQVAVMKTRLKALGYGGATGAYEVKGAKSSVRLRSDQKMEFVVRVASLQVDPSSVIQLVSLQAEKDKRRLVTVKVSPLGIGGSTTDNNAGAIQFNTTKHGESSLKIAPAQPLAPGEYAFKAPGASEVFYCFGVDAMGLIKQKK